MRDQSRFFSALPYQAMTAVAATLAVFVSGCTSGNRFAASLIPVQERLRAADSEVADAVAAFEKGATDQGNESLTRAVILLNSPSDLTIQDEGAIEVAKRVAALSRPQDAVRLLEPYTKDKYSSEDPLLWATLSQVARQAGNMPRANATQSTAEQKAAAIMKKIGGPIPKEPDASIKAVEFTRAGSYYSEYAKNYPLAIQAYREAKRLLPDSFFTLNALGYTLADHGTTTADFDEAVQLTLAAVEKAPDAPELLDSYGWALFKRNNKKERDMEGARRRLREAVDLAPSLPECRYHLAAVYEKLGLYADSDLEAASAVLLRPDYEEAKALRDRVKPLIPKPDASPSPEASPSASPSPEASPTPAPSPSASPVP